MTTPYFSLVEEDETILFIVVFIAFIKKLISFFRLL